MTPTPEVWTAKEIAEWLRLSQRHVADRLVHDPRFPRPLKGCVGKKRWIKDEVVEWVMSR